MSSGETVQVDAPGTWLEGSTAGELLGCCYVNRRGPNHVLRKTGGSFGVSESILKWLQQSGVVWLIFEYHGIRESCLFVCRLHDLLCSKLRYNYHGCDLQRHIRLDDPDMVKVPGAALKNKLVGVLNKVQHVDSRVILERVKKAANIDLHDKVGVK